MILLSLSGCICNHFLLQYICRSLKEQKEVFCLIFGKHINRYYLRYGPMLIFGLLSLVAVDYLQLIIPELYQMVVDGMFAGSVTVDGTVHAFNMEFLLNTVCMPMIGVILSVPIQAGITALILQPQEKKKK